MELVRDGLEREFTNRCATCAPSPTIKPTMVRSSLGVAMMMSAIALAAGDPAESDVPQILPILPVRNSVLYPGGLLPLEIGSPMTLALIRDAEVIGVVCQRIGEVDDPLLSDLYTVGTVARVVKVTKKGETKYEVLVQGLARFRVKEAIQSLPYLKARIERVDDVAPAPNDRELEALTIKLKKRIRELMGMTPEAPAELLTFFDSVTRPGPLADLSVANIPDLPTAQKQTVLEAFDLKARVNLAIGLVNDRLETLKKSKRQRGAPTKPRSEKKSE